MTCCISFDVTWCCASNCTHYGKCGECSSGVLTKEDRRLFNQVRMGMNSQNGCARCCMQWFHCCFWYAACWGLLCESSSNAYYHTQKLDQLHRFEECVCCNMVLSFTMKHDPTYKGDTGNFGTGGGSSVINIVNTNENKIGDINVTSSPIINVSNEQKSNGSEPMSESMKMVKKARMEAMIREGRFSDAEVIAIEIKD